MREPTHVLGIAGAVALLAASVSAHAVPVCPPVEFAELQTYTEKELDDLWFSYIQKSVRMPYGAGQRGHEEKMREIENCNEQVKRVQRVQFTRFPKKPTTTTPATPAG